MSTLQLLEHEAYHAVLLVLATQQLDWVSLVTGSLGLRLSRLSSFPSSSYPSCQCSGSGR